MNLEELPPRLVGRIVVDWSGCWLWQGRPDTNGYGQTRWPGRRGDPFVPVHRLVYHLLVAELDLRPGKGGETIDHLCRVRLCVNPAHLEPVSRGENTRRGWEFRRACR